MSWPLIGDAAQPASGGVLMSERLSWPRTVGIGLQHVVATFGATAVYHLLRRAGRASPSSGEQ